MSHIAQVNVLAILAAAVVALLAGAVWYGPLFGSRWMAASEMTPERAARARLGRLMAATMVLLVLGAALLAVRIGPGSSVTTGALAGALAGAWVGSALGIVYLFEQRPLAHWLVNAGYLGTAAVLMGVVLGAWG